MSDRIEQHVPIQFYRFKGSLRWRWAAGLPAIPGKLEGYGATPREALEALTEGINSDDMAALLALVDRASTVGSEEQ